MFANSLVKIVVTIRHVTRDAQIRAFRAKRSANGNADTKSAPSYAMSCAIGILAMQLVINAWDVGINV